jgi:hypothetical protein
VPLVAIGCFDRSIYETEGQNAQRLSNLLPCTIQPGRSPKSLISLAFFEIYLLF